MRVGEDALQLLSEISGANRFGFKTAQHKRATEFVIRCQDGVGLKFSTSMVDLADRLEVGVIRVDKILPDNLVDKEIASPADLAGSLKCEKLVIETDFGLIESGVLFTGQNEHQVVIVAGAFPYTVEVAITSTVFGMSEFDPEYPIDEYERQPIT